MAKKKEERPGHAEVIDHHFRRYIEMFTPPGTHREEFLTLPPRSPRRRELIDSGMIIQPPNGPKEGTLVKGLLRTYGVDRTLWLIDQMFDSHDPRVKRGDYTLGWLKVIAPHIISSHSGATQGSDRLSGNISAAKQAMEG